jgi:hypothetical protein
MFRIVKIHFLVSTSKLGMLCKKCGQETFNAHQPDLVLDPVIEDVEDKGPYGLERKTPGCFNRDV